MINNFGSGTLLVTTTFVLISLFFHGLNLQVGPRDGLQNEKTVVPTNTKVEFINRLAAAGLRQEESSLS